MAPHVSTADVHAFIMAWLLVQARILALFAVLPSFGQSLVPGMLRLGVAAGFSVIAVPPLMAGMHAGPPQGLPLLVLLVKESLIGAILGYVAAVPFWAFEAAGAFIDNQRGASIAATINPATGHDTSPLGILFAQAFIVLFFVGGGFLVVLGLLYDSYALWPVLDFWPRLDESSGALLMSQLNRLVALGALLAAPVLIPMFLAEIGLAFVGRFAPQLEVFSLAMPVKSALALFVIVLYAGNLFDYGQAEIRELGAWVARLATPFGGAPR